MESTPSEVYSEREDDEEDQQKVAERITRLWGQYGFPGSPPKPKSIAQNRLEDYCRDYIHVLTDEVMNKGNMAALSDSRRRELHNNIALMVVGAERSALDQDEGDRIANFASELIFGQSIVTMYEELRKARERREQEE